MSFWDIPDASVVRDASTRIVLGPIRQNLMLLMGKFGAENYSRAATVQELLDLGIVNIDRGTLYASGGAGGGSGSQSATQAAADRAQTSATNAAGSASSAATSSVSAATSAGLASDAADQAQGFATNAGNSATLAQDWASKAEDSIVSGGKYSALHYAAKASDSADAAAQSAIDASENASLLEENAANTDDYTLALTDQGKVVVMNVSTTGKEITVPANIDVAFPVGALVHIYNRSADDVSVSGDTGVTVRNAGNIVQYGEARLRKRATNEWVLSIY